MKYVPCALIILLMLNNPVHGQAGPRLLIRSDDMGFSHGANAANEQVLASGLVMNVSVLFAAPWYQEAVRILSAFPEVAIGVHLCANAEWHGYTWGPVADRSRVPSLVNEDGHFYGSYRALNVDRTPRTEELEIEFRAQIDRALKTGLPIAYVDNHMGAGLATEDQRAMVRRLAASYGLAFSGGFDEVSPGRFSGEDYDFDAQRDRLIALIDALAPDTLYRLVFHLGTDTPELQAMRDTNEGGVVRMSVQRQIERDLLLDPAVRDALRRRNVRLLTYRELR